MVFTREFPTGTHPFVAECLRIGQHGSTAVWSERAFSVTTTESTRRPVELSATTVEPGETIEVKTGSPAGDEPCPVVGSTPWSSVRVELLKDELVKGEVYEHGEEKEGEYYTYVAVAEREYSVDGAEATLQTEYPFTIPTTLVPGESFLTFVHCEQPNLTNEWPVAFEYDPIGIKVVAPGAGAPGSVPGVSSQLRTVARTEGAARSDMEVAAALVSYEPPSFGATRGSALHPADTPAKRVWRLLSRWSRTWSLTENISHHLRASQSPSHA